MSGRRDVPNLGTYWAQGAAEDRRLPVSTGHITAIDHMLRTKIAAVDGQVRVQMRTSSPTWANMQRVPAGVAQSAEQPSCKRQVSGSNPLTGSQVRPMRDCLLLLGVKPQVSGGSPRWQSQARTGRAVVQITD